jgi:hypothetical protein
MGTTERIDFEKNGRIVGFDQAARKRQQRRRDRKIKAIREIERHLKRRKRFKYTSRSFVLRKDYCDLLRITLSQCIFVMVIVASNLITAQGSRLQLQLHLTP